MSQVMGVGAIGLRQAPIGTCEGTNAPGVDGRHREPSCAQGLKGGLLATTCSFQDDQGGLVLQEQIADRTDAFGVVGKAPGSLAIAKG